MKVIIPLFNMGLNSFVEWRQNLVRGRTSYAGKEE
jgi:hypothetical protein